jgi:NADH dehydrogenase (ubiquinone) 1 alpha subcomplex subunit 9
LSAADDVQVKRGVGRQSVSGITATVFGASGFLGRYVVNRLGLTGSQVVCPYRGDGFNMRHLKLSGDLGQIVPMPIDFIDEDSIRECLMRSNVVINLIGGNIKTNNYNYHDTNVKCTFRLAKLAAEAGGVKRFIHVSALGADNNSPSDLLKAKYEGEEVVRDFFPNATIVRPAPIFGDEDKFLNRYADLMNLGPVCPVLNGGNQRLQPVFVRDVAQAIVNCITSEDAPGRTVDVCGPQVFTQNEIADLVAEQCYIRDHALLAVPDWAGSLIGKIQDKAVPHQMRLYGEDEFNQQKVDLVDPKNNGNLTLADLAITPRRLDQEASGILMKHRANRYAIEPPRLGKYVDTAH